MNCRRFYLLLTRPVSPSARRRAAGWWRGAATWMVGVHLGRWPSSPPSDSTRELSFSSCRVSAPGPCFGAAGSLCGRPPSRALMRVAMSVLRFSSVALRECPPRQLAVCASLLVLPLRRERVDSFIWRVPSLTAARTGPFPRLFIHAPALAAARSGNEAVLSLSCVVGAGRWRLCGWASQRRPGRVFPPEPHAGLELDRTKSTRANGHAGRREPGRGLCGVPTAVARAREQVGASMESARLF